MSADHYRVLGVDPEADDEQIRRAFRTLSRRHHPDLGGDADAYRQVTVAYTVLSDPDRRSRYDAQRSGPTTTGTPRARPTSSGRASSGGTTSSGTAASARTPSAASAQGPAGPRLATRPVRLIGADTGTDPSPRVRGEAPKRGLFDRSRDLRTGVVQALTTAVARDVPAVRAVLGVDLGEAGTHDAVLAAGRRLVLVDVIISRDTPHGWDGSRLRADGRRRAVPAVAAAAAALERKVGGSRATGLVVVAIHPGELHRPVIDAYGRTSPARPAPANPAGAKREIVTFLGSGADADAVDLSILSALTALS